MFELYWHMAIAPQIFQTSPSVPESGLPHLLIWLKGPFWWPSTSFKRWDTNQAQSHRSDPVPLGLGLRTVRRRLSPSAFVSPRFFFGQSPGGFVPFPTMTVTMRVALLKRILCRPPPPLAISFRSSSSSSTTPEATRLLKVGDVLRQSRRFSESDVARYSEVSGDRNPVHFDADFAQRIAGFDGGRVVHGMLVASLFPSVIASHFVCCSFYLSLYSSA